MRNIFLLFFIVLLSNACRQKRNGKSPLPGDKTNSTVIVEHTVAILPFSGIDSSLVAHIKMEMAAQLGIKVFVLEEIKLPVNAWYKPRMRYIADSLLVFLDKNKGPRYEKIIGITTKDISTRKGEIANWGVLGLGNCPGASCVISTFRAGKNKVKEIVFNKRMVTLALHELGHTYGLQHCPDSACLMKDAAGKMNLDDGDTYCNKCKMFLRRSGIIN